MTISVHGGYVILIFISMMIRPTTIFSICRAKRDPNHNYISKFQTINDRNIHLPYNSIMVSLVGFNGILKRFQDGNWCIYSWIR